MTKKDFDKWHKTGLMQRDEAEVVEETINKLIENLYCPCEDERVEHGIDFVADGEKLKKHQINNEPINWGDLKVVEIKPFKDGEYLVVVDEAAPNCVGLITYIEKFMHLWGWKVRVQTEW